MDIKGELGFLNQDEQRLLNLPEVVDAAILPAELAEARQRLQGTTRRSDINILSEAVYVVLDYQEAMSHPKHDLFSVNER